MRYKILQLISDIRDSHDAKTVKSSTASHLFLAILYLYK